MFIKKFDPDLGSNYKCTGKLKKNKTFCYEISFKSRKDCRDIVAMIQAASLLKGSNSNLFESILIARFWDGYLRYTTSVQEVLQFEVQYTVSVNIK